MLTAHWPAVTALAHALIEEGRVEGEDVERIVDSACSWGEADKADWQTPLNSVGRTYAAGETRAPLRHLSPSQRINMSTKGTHK